MKSEQAVLPNPCLEEEEEEEEEYLRSKYSLPSQPVFFTEYS
jgi:hypothetical protein